MKVIDQYFEFETEIDFEGAMLAIERIARVSYKSEDKIDTNSATKFITDRITSEHYPILEMQDMVIHFVTDRGVSHELVRHRLASFVQESTRYCNYSKDKFNNELTFIRPVWLDVRVLDANVSMANPAEMNIWVEQMMQIESAYMRLLNLGWSPQQARSVLPNSLKTEIIVKANFREWRHIFLQRALSKGAHPQMRALMLPLYEYCRIKCPVIFDLGIPE